MVVNSATRLVDFLKVLCVVAKFSYKSNPNDFWGYFKKRHFLTETCFGHFWKHWATFYSNICGQSYKQFTIVIYDSRVVMWGNFKSGTTLES